MLSCNVGGSCGLEFSNASLFVDHVKQIHRVDTFICVICQMKFTRAYAYKRHLKKEFEKVQDNNQSYSVNSNESSNNNFAELPFFENTFQTSNTENMENVLMELPMYDGSTAQYSTFEDNLFRLVLDMYGSMRLSKKLAVDFTQKVQETICKPLLDLIVSKLLCEADLEQVKILGSNIEHIFDEIDSEHKFKSLLKNKNLYFEATKFDIATDNDDSKGYIFPLKLNIKALFESRPDLLLNMILQYDFDSESTKIDNIINTPIWKQKIASLGNRRILPILLYQDDIEINNPLGSKAGVHKISTVYISFPLLSGLNISKLCFHIPACLTLTSDFSAGLYSNSYFLAMELKTLEENGIIFTLYGDTIKVHFIVAAPVGDNLSLNMMLGFSMSFNVDCFCRFCICTKREIEILTTEATDKMRINAGIAGTKLGFKRDSPLTKEIRSFNILHCMSVDIVHDFLEGIIKLEMSNLLNYFIRMAYFDLEFLNEALKEYNQYDRFERKNKCSKIKKGHLDNITLKMSATEIALFIKYFAVLVKDHIPNNDKYLIFFKVMYKLLNTVTKSSFTESELNNLDLIIKEHHEQFISLKLGTKSHPDRLTPKHHIITHYVTSIRMLGPPKFFWVMRLEALHKNLKQYANVSSSRRNILKSLADKIQLNNSQMFFKSTSGLKILKTKVMELINLSNLKIENDFGNFPINFKLPTYYSLAIENIRFEISDIVLTLDENNESNCKVFQIKKLFCIKNEIKFLTSKLNIVKYHEDIQMLEVNFPNEANYHILDITDIICLPTNLKMYNNKNVINIANF